MLKQRRNFDLEPEKVWLRFNERVPELLNIEAEEPWSLDKYGREQIGFGHHKLAKRAFFLMAQMHKAARKENHARLRGLIVQGAKFFEKVVQDNGSQEMAACLLPYEDPAAIPDRAMPQSSSSSSSSDPFAGLCDPSESALGLRYLTDMSNFEEAKSKRLKGEGKGKWKDKKGEADQGPPPKKKP